MSLAVYSNDGCDAPWVILCAFDGIGYGNAGIRLNYFTIVA
jgi:hypothetical protein